MRDSAVMDTPATGQVQEEIGAVAESVDNAKPWHGDDHHDAPFVLRAYGVMGVHGSVTILRTETQINGVHGSLPRSSLARLSIEIERAVAGRGRLPV